MSGSNGISIGKRIYKLREAREMSQQDIADALNVKRETVSMWENGSRDIKTQYTVGLSSLFDVSTDYLLGVTGDERKEPSPIDTLGLTPRAVNAITAMKEYHPNGLDIIDHMVYSNRMLSAITNLSLSVGERIKATDDSNTLIGLCDAEGIYCAEKIKERGGVILTHEDMSALYRQRAVDAFMGFMDEYIDVAIKDGAPDGDD